MSRPVIEVEGLGKAYRLGAREEVPDTLLGAARQVLGNPLRNLRALRGLNTFGSVGEDGGGENGVAADGTMWALRDVSFTVSEGEVVGVIGRNGAGKSTLLKVLSRITEPTVGRAVIRGRVSSLLEVGTGFHPELSGRDNIYMNGTVLGMTKREIDRKFEEIVEFSGVEKMLDTPIKRYSSGQKVRLAFSVAAHLEPEILIIDEVLAVGDAEFQRKCLGKMKDVAGEGRTVLFVSHNMAAVRQLCTRVVWLVGGRVRGDGATVAVTGRYLATGMAGAGHTASFTPDPARAVQVLAARVVHQPGLPPGTCDVDRPLEVELDLEVRRSVPRLTGYLSFYRDDAPAVLVADSTDRAPDPLNFLPPGGHRVRLTVPPRTLGAGDYTVYLNLADRDDRNQAVDTPGDMLAVTLTDLSTARGDRRAGFLSTITDWAVRPADDASADDTPAGLRAAEGAGRPGAHPVAALA